MRGGFVVTLALIALNLAAAIWGTWCPALNAFAAGLLTADAVEDVIDGTWRSAA